MFFRNFKTLLDEKFGYMHPETYAEELNCQCRVGAVPVAILSFVAWLPFIPLDMQLHPHLPILIYLRLGYTVIGLIALVVHYAPVERIHPFFAKYKDYFIMVFLIGYLQVASGAIVGLVGADPVYMGGYGIVLLILAFLPIRLLHIWILMVASLAIFIVTGLDAGMTFGSGRGKYGLLNVIFSVLLVMLIPFILNHIRKSHHRMHLLVQKRVEEKIDNYLQAKGVTKREIEIAHMIIAGKSNSQIEAELFISMHTVKNHAYRIYQKLGIKNRVQLTNLIQNIKKNGDSG